MKCILPFNIIFLALLSFMPMALFADNAELQPYRSGMNEIVNGFNSKDPSAFIKAIDIDAILNNALNDPFLDTKFTNEFRVSFKNTGAQQLGEKINSKLAADYRVKLVRLVKQDTGAKALIRLNFGENGYGYMDLQLRTDANSEVRIINWFDYSSGRLYTETLHQLIAMLSPTPTAVGKLFDFATNKKAQTKNVVSLIKLNQQGKHKEMIEQFLASSSELRKNRILNFFAVQSGNQSGNTELYLKALENMNRYYSDDAKIQLVLVDYHFLTESYDKAIRSLELVEKSFGVKEAGIELLISNTYLTSGNLNGSIKHARNSISLEPDFEDAYWSLLLAYVNNKEFANAVKISAQLERRFQYDLGPDSLKQAEVYNTLLLSNEYREWRKSM